MLRLEDPAVRERLRDDAELARSAREWSGALHLVAGRARVALRFADGRLDAVDPSGAEPGARDVVLAAEPGEWAKLLARAPAPFYQDPFGASLHHAVSLGGDLETLFAYYPALRRVLEILREAAE